MRIWVDMDSGTFGTSDIEWVELDETELDEFSNMSDSERIALTREIREAQ